MLPTFEVCYSIVRPRAVSRSNKGERSNFIVLLYHGDVMRKSYNGFEPSPVT